MSDRYKEMWEDAFHDNLEKKAEISELKAEVEFLKKQYAEAVAQFRPLREQVERLTKAGDLMCRMAGNNQVINRHWKTAKEGKQAK